MRDYTRKAKIKDSNEWVIGYHVYVDYLDKHYILVSKKTHDGFSGMLAMKQYEVDGDTICNPTGLTDKSGNKIWENDVVCTPYVDPIFGDMVNDKILDDYTWKVVFVDGGFCVENEDKIINLRSFTNGNHIKAIGNIFDNEDLLKGE